MGNNRYLLFDNGLYSSQYTGSINVSRAVEYYLDTNLMTCEKVWEFIHPDSLYSKNVSSVQRLPNGNTLINFGNLQDFNLGSIVTEVDQNSQIVFQLEFPSNVRLYRARKYDWFFDNYVSIEHQKTTIKDRLIKITDILGRKQKRRIHHYSTYTMTEQ